MEHLDVGIGSLLPAHEDSAEAIHPTVSAFDDPASSAKSGSTLDSLRFFAARLDVCGELKRSNELTVLLKVVAFVQTQVLGREFSANRECRSSHRYHLQRRSSGGHGDHECQERTRHNIPRSSGRGRTMPFAIVIESKVKGKIREIVDAAGALAFVLQQDNPKEFPFLGHVDPYGDTIFNTVQASPVLEEWRRLEGPMTLKGQRNFYKAVEEMLVEVESGTHVFLRFVGD